MGTHPRTAMPSRLGGAGGARDARVSQGSALFVGKGFEIHNAVQGFELRILVDQNSTQLAGDPSDQRIGQG